MCLASLSASRGKSRCSNKSGPCWNSAAGNSKQQHRQARKPWKSSLLTVNKTAGIQQNKCAVGIQRCVCVFALDLSDSLQAPQVGSCPMRWGIYIYEDRQMRRGGSCHQRERVREIAATEHSSKIKRKTSFWADFWERFGTVPRRHSGTWSVKAERGSRSRSDVRGGEGFAGVRSDVAFGWQAPVCFQGSKREAKWRV